VGVDHVAATECSGLYDHSGVAEVEVFRSTGRSADDDLMAGLQVAGHQ
jgi:hypothetical protein